MRKIIVTVMILLFCFGAVAAIVAVETGRPDIVQLDITEAVRYWPIVTGITGSQDVVPAVLKEHETMAAVSVEELKRDVTPQDYLALTLGDQANAERAIEKAAVWAKGKILSTGNVFDENNEVVRQVIVTRALYELYFFVGYPDRAKAREEDAADLIESYFGSIATRGDSNMTGPAGGAVIVPELPGYGR
jgi:hypothetical protein